MIDIVERLRKPASVKEQTWEWALRNEAADALEAKDAEIERLRKSQDELRRIRELCIKALCAVTGASSDAIESAPLTEALKAKARAERAEAERDALRKLYDAKIPLHERRKLPSPVWNESDDALTASFWPDCTCVECYALHHMAKARAALATARRDALEEAKSLVAKLFAAARFDKTTHLGLGDIRLTIGHQEDIVSAIRALAAQPSSPPQAPEQQPDNKSLGVTPAAGGGHDDYSEHDYGDK